MRRFMGLHICCFTIPVLVVMAGVAWGQTEVRPGLNLFTLDQDVEIGKRSAIRVERELPMLSEPAVSRYVANLGSRLAAHAPTGKFTYQFKVANLADVNAFALPGGYIYVHRGLLEKVRSEGELAGVIAHEIAHVELRHSTNQASKACLAQSGVGILGGGLGGHTQTTTGEIVQAVGGCGLNALFLKYSRGAETQADIVGAQIMARAGYDPMEMVRIFELLRQQSEGHPGKAARYLSDHPAPADREARVRQEATLLGPVRPVLPVGSVTALHEDLSRLAPAPTMELASAEVPTEAQSLGPASGSATISVEPPSAPASGSATISVERPSTRLRSLRQREGLFELQYPDNWSAYARGYGVTIAPRGGIVTASGGRQSLACGVVVNHYVPFDGMVGAGYRDPLGSFFGKTPLGEATSDLVRQVMHSNPQLQPIAGSMRHRTISGAPSFSVSLSGRSPVTGVGERMIVFTRLLPDEHVIYMLFVAPAKDFDMLAPASERMVQSLKIDARTAHP